MMNMDTKELNAIESEAAAAEALEGEHIAAGDQAEAAAPQGPDLAAEIGGLVRTVVAVFAPMLPSLPGIYTDATVDTAAGAVAKVCQKHGWLQDGVFGEFGEEITCAMILIPLAVQTNAAVRADLAALAAKNAAADQVQNEQQEA